MKETNEEEDEEDPNHNASLCDAVLFGKSMLAYSTIVVVGPLLLCSAKYQKRKRTTLFDFDFKLSQWQ